MCLCVGMCVCVFKVEGGEGTRPDVKWRGGHGRNECGRLMSAWLTRSNCLLVRFNKCLTLCREREREKSVGSSFQAFPLDTQFGPLTALKGREGGVQSKLPTNDT